MYAVVDTGPLYVAADRGALSHAACVAALERPDLQLVIPTLVIAEVTYLLNKHLGSRAEAAFVRSLSEMDIEAPSSEDWERIANLVETYADFPLGTADASVVALAERLGTDCVITLDRHHFGAVRPRHVPAFRLLPE